MPLESLLKLVEKLRERIDSHSAALRQSEALTRYALIDPLLRELGWDTEDPDVVVPEYSSGGGRVDYALLANSKPLMMVEAKKHGTSLQDGRKQAVEYAMDETDIKARYFSVTDGAYWAIYDTDKPANDMLAASFDLNEKSVEDACLKSLALWRKSVISGHETPVIGLLGNQTNTTESQPAEETPVQPTSPILHEEGWVPLSEFYPQTGDPKPTEILFPDNSSVSINTWRTLIVEVARWLTDNNILDTDHCPIQGVGKAKRYLVSTTPTHSELKNKPLFTRGEQLGSLHIETNYSGPGCVENVQTMIKHVGQDPALFKVRLP